MVASGIFYFLMGSATELVIFGLVTLVNFSTLRIKKAFEEIKTGIRKTAERRMPTSGT